MTTPNNNATSSASSVLPIRQRLKSSAQIRAELDALMEKERRFDLFADGTPVHKLKSGKNYYKLIALPDHPMPYLCGKTFWSRNWGNAFITPAQASRIDELRIAAARRGDLKCGKTPNGTFDMQYKQKMVFLAIEIVPPTSRGGSATYSAPKLLVLPSSDMKPQVGDVVAGLANEQDVSGKFKNRDIFNWDDTETQIICIEVSGEGRNTSYTAKVDGTTLVPVVDVDVVNIHNVITYIDDARLFGSDAPPAQATTTTAAPDTDTDDIPFK